jgi:hypothetical protein
MNRASPSPPVRLRAATITIQTDDGAIPGVFE